MTTTPSSPKWQQLDMFGTSVVEISLTVGVVAGADHCQFQVEAWQPQRLELLAMVSIPHCSLADSAEGLSAAVAELVQLVHDYTGPF